MLSAALLSLALAVPSNDPLEWEAVARGVWRARIGEPEAFTLLSASEPFPDPHALAVLPEEEFPFEDGAVRGHATALRSGLRVPLGAEESVYGLGLDFDRVRQNGRIHRLHVDHWGGTTGRTHAPVPFTVTSSGVGVFVDSARYLDVYVGTGLRADSDAPPTIRDRTTDRAWQAHPPGDSIEWSIPAPGATVYVFAGPTPLDAVRRFTAFTGGGVLPPRWGLGFTHRTPTPYSGADVVAEVDAFDERGFPLEFIGLEPGWQSHAYPCSFEWDPTRYPDPTTFVRGLLERGVRVNLWANPYVLPGSDLAEELAPFAASHRVWNGMIVDYELPEARARFGRHVTRELLDRGVSGFKLDEVDGFDRWLWPDSAVFPSGRDAEQIRQTYGVRLMGLVDDLYRERGERTWGLVRASNAGASHLPFVLYNDHYSHRDFITALCNASFSGLLWTPEVRSSDSAEEWLRRMQTVCVSPLAMLNAWASGTKPWSFPEVSDAVRDTMLLRMRLVPYLYTAFAHYRFESMPPLRAMPLVEGWQSLADERERRPFLKTQFLVGDSLLAAPLFAGETERAVLLPPGPWFDFYTGAPVGDGLPGPVTTRLRDLYWELHQDPRYMTPVRYDLADSARASVG